MTPRRSVLLHIAVGLGLLGSMFFMPPPTTAEMKTPQSQQGSGDMRSMKEMMGECREHHDKAYKAIDRILMKIEEGQRSNDATQMRTALETSQNGLADLKQDMATCMNMMSMLEKTENGMGGHMGEMGGMREGVGGMMEGKSR